MSEFRTFRVLIPGDNSLLAQNRRVFNELPEFEPDTETDIILNPSHIVSVTRRDNDVFIVTINSTWKSADTFENLRILLDAPFVGG